MAAGTPAPDVVELDFAQIAAAGLNTVRTYTVPPRWLLDAAQHQGYACVKQGHLVQDHPRANCRSAPGRNLEWTALRSRSPTREELGNWHEDNAGAAELR
jgi:hypothetical protein